MHAGKKSELPAKHVSTVGPNTHIRNCLKKKETAFPGMESETKKKQQCKQSLRCNKSTSKFIFQILYYNNINNIIILFQCAYRLKGNTVSAPDVTFFLRCIAPRCNS